MSGAHWVAGEEGAWPQVHERGEHAGEGGRGLLEASMAQASCRQSPAVGVGAIAHAPRGAVAGNGDSGQNPTGTMSAGNTAAGSGSHPARGARPLKAFQFRGD